MIALSDDTAMEIADFVRRPIHAIKVLIARRRFDRALRHFQQGNRSSDDWGRTLRAAFALHRLEPFAGVAADLSPETFTSEVMPDASEPRRHQEYTP